MNKVVLTLWPVCVHVVLRLASFLHAKVKKKYFVHKWSSYNRRVKLFFETNLAIVLEAIIAPCGGCCSSVAVAVGVE